MEGDLHLRERVFAQYCPTAIFMDYSPQQLEEDEETEVSLEALTYDPGYSFNRLPDEGDNIAPADLILQDLGEYSLLSPGTSIKEQQI
ncbi:hypothetical protein EON65_13330 [archaeon]|nr:MAG: hypothetical protein EON65_13330 [archaeon]